MALEETKLISRMVEARIRDDAGLNGGFCQEKRKCKSRV